jgi:hypothetical protein
MEDLLLAVLRDRPARMVTVAGIEAGLDQSRWHRVPIQPAAEGRGGGDYTLIFNAMGLPAVAGFALAFLRRARSLIIASAGLATFAALSRDG